VRAEDGKLGFTLTKDDKPGGQTRYSPLAAEERTPGSEAGAAAPTFAGAGEYRLDDPPIMETPAGFVHPGRSRPVAQIA